jgi:hypothetical protein
MGVYAIAVFLLFVEYQTIVIAAAVARSHGVPLAVKVVLGLLVVTLPAAICARLGRVGVYTGRAGLRYIGPMRTKMVAWADVSAVEVTDAPMPRQLVIRQSNGVVVPLPLLFKGSAFILGGASTEAIRERLSSELSRHGS